MIKKRVILWWMLFSGILIHMFQKTNINIALISMIEPLDIQKNSPMIEDSICSTSNSSLQQTKTTVYKSSIYSKSDSLQWDEHTQNLILGGFFWFAWISQFFGGMLAHKFGSKLTFGLTNFIACILSAAIPKLAFIDYKLVLAVRVLQGTIGSLGIPAGIITIIGHWSPPHERGKFMSVLLGVAFGVALGYPIFGTVGEYFGWPHVFYSTSILGIIWYIGWLFLVYDSPDSHPTITPEEKKYILDQIGGNLSKTQLPIPWKDILTSIPFLINVMAQFGTQWYIQTLNIYTPSYFRFVHGIDTEMGGIIIGIAFGLKSAMSLAAGAISDFIIRKKILKTQYVRKLSVFVSSVLAGLILLGIPAAKCDIYLATTCLTIAIVINAFFLTGVTVAILDMSPNFSSILQGICGTISVSAGFLSPFVTDQLPFDNNSMQKWEWLFYITAGWNVFTGMIFILFGNSNLQPWNAGKIVKNESNMEMNNGKSKTMTAA